MTVSETTPKNIPPVTSPISAAAHTDSLSSLSTSPAPINDEVNLVPLSVIRECLRSGKPLPSSSRRGTFDEALSPDKKTDGIVGGTLTPSRKLSAIKNRLRSLSRAEALLPSPTPSSSVVKPSLEMNQGMDDIMTSSPLCIDQKGYTHEMIDIVDLLFSSSSFSPAMTAGDYAHDAICSFVHILHKGKEALLSNGDPKGCDELEAFERGLLFAARGHFRTARSKEVELLLESECTEEVSQIDIHDLVGDDVDDLDDDDDDNHGLDNEENEIDDENSFDEDKLLADIVLKELCKEENSASIIADVSVDEGDNESCNKSHKNNETKDNIDESTTLNALDEVNDISDDENDDWSYASPRESIGRYSTTKMTRSGETPVRRSLRIRNSLEDCMNQLNLED